MASARDFCRIPGYPISIFFTYSFDPLFFERVPWADLEVGGSNRIVIAADVDQVAEAMRRCMGQVAYLGRRYVLAETNAVNVFHPKLIVRLRAWQGATHIVNVIPDGFEWQSIRYRSLSAIAKAITGTSWNGYIFFGVKRRPPRNKNAAGPRRPKSDCQSATAAIPGTSGTTSNA